MHITNGLLKHTQVVKRPDFLYSHSYKWAHTFRKGVPHKVVRLPKGVASYYTTSEELGLGEVQQLYGDNTND